VISPSLKMYNIGDLLRRPWRHWARAAPWAHLNGGRGRLRVPPGDQIQLSADTQTQKCDI
jgi:hypothetical protein